MVTQTQITRRVGKIKDILEEVRDTGHDMDLTKAAVEIYELAREDVKESEIDMADFGTLDAAADMRED